MNERRRVLCSSVMSDSCTLICSVESFGQSWEKIQAVFIFVRYGKIQHMSKDECCIFQYRTQMNTVCISYCYTGGQSHRKITKHGLAKIPVLGQARGCQYSHAGAKHGPDIFDPL